MTAVSTGETVTVAKKYVSELLTTIVKGVNRWDKIDTATLKACAWMFDHTDDMPDGPEDPVTVPVEVLWDLNTGSAATSVYDLDDAAEATYEHPAVDAELTVDEAVREQAPRFYKRYLVSIGAS